MFVVGNLKKKHKALFTKVLYVCNIDEQNLHTKGMTAVKMQSDTFITSFVAEAVMLPADTNVFKSLSALHPDAVLSQTAPLLFTQFHLATLRLTLTGLSNSTEKILFVSRSEENKIVLPRARFSWWVAWGHVCLGVTRWETVKALRLKLQV